MQISNFHLDWFSFTFKTVSESVDDFLETFWERFPELKYLRNDMYLVSGRNYAVGLSYEDDFYIRYDKEGTSKGINVEIPSHGLEHFCKILRVNTVKCLFNTIYGRGCTPSRIDICFDDFSMKYKPRYYYNKFLSGDLVTRMREVKMCHSSDNAEGETFYLGDRRKRMIRIYNKDIESGGEIKSIRYEIELHANAALDFMMHIIDSDNTEVCLFGDYLLTVFSVRKKNENDLNNKTRWEMNKSWYSWFKSTFSQNYISIPHIRPEDSAESLEEYARSVYSVINYMICRYGLKNVLMSIKEKGLSKKQIRVLQGLAVNNGFEPDFYIRGSLINF